MRETAETFSRVTGRRVEYRQLSWEELERQAGAEMTTMYRWFERVGYDADLAALRREFGELTSIEQYLHSHGWAGAGA